jgi:hypothetical protein
MYRVAMWLLFAFLVLGAIGWWTEAYAIFEWFRLAAVGCLALGMLLLIVDYVRSPEAPNEGKP